MSAARPFATIVTGVPRSGTSLVMQMLAAGGLPLLADDARPPDADNPRGYFECERVKRIASDASFVADAIGRALKIVVPLVRHLPASLAARVLFVDRDLDHVIASQERMLVRRGSAEAGAIEPARLAAILARQIDESRAFLVERTDTQVLRVEHSALLGDPHATATAIGAFLGGGLDAGAMAAAVDAALHRERGGSEWTPPAGSPIVAR
jgi:hypothetical protein